MINLPAIRWYVPYLSVVAMILLSLVACQSQGKDSPDIERITVEDLSKRPPIGRLGKPLGTLVTIEGVYVLEPDGKSDPRRAMTKEAWRRFRIETVDGKRLPKPVDYEIVRDRLIRKMKPRNGERFKLLGFESGHFYGAPEEAEDLLTDTIARRNPVPFRFETVFQAVKDEIKNISERDAYERQ